MTVTRVLWLLLLPLLRLATAHGELRAAELAAAQAGQIGAFYAVTRGSDAEPGAGACAAGAGDDGCRQDLSLLQVTAGAYHRGGEPRLAGPAAAAVSALAAAAPAAVPVAAAAGGPAAAPEAAAPAAASAEAGGARAAADGLLQASALEVPEAPLAKAAQAAPVPAAPPALGDAAAASGDVPRPRPRREPRLGPQTAAEEAAQEGGDQPAAPALGPQVEAAEAPRRRVHLAAPLAALAPALRRLGAIWERLPGLPLPRARASASQPPALQQRSSEAAGLEASEGAASALEAVALAGTSAAEGDIVQGLVFTLICLIIVIGIYLLVFSEYRPGESGQPLAFDRAAGGRPSTWRWAGEGAAAGLLPGVAASRLASAKSLASGRETLQAASVSQISRFGGMPGTPPTSLPTPQERISSIVGGSREDDWYAELPEIYPQLVIPAAHTRLAVPLAQLTQPSFVLDILSRAGVPLLNAQLDEGPTPTVEICQQDGQLLASVTSDLAISGRDGQPFGTLCRERVAPQLGLADCPQLVMRDRLRRPICVLVATRRDAGGYDFKLHSVSAGRLVERATAVRRPPQPPPHGRLPGEHYELVVNPQVDAVLVLAILLGAAVFAMRPVSGPIAPPMSGRASMTPADLS